MGSTQASSQSPKSSVEQYCSISRLRERLQQPPKYEYPNITAFNFTVIGRIGVSYCVTQYIEKNKEK
jgi:hypothetical protein